MTQSPKLVTIFGGSGFVGRYIARRMAKAGWRVRVAVRRPNEAIFVKPYGVVGQVEPVLANIRDDASTLAAIAGADAVVNCVGTFDARGKNNFDAVQAEGPGRVARMAAQAGVQSLVHISSIGADAESNSSYFRSKAKGEENILDAFPGAVILRPSVIFGPEDDFFNRFAKLAKMLPIVTMAGAGTLFQPVYVDDVAAAAATALLEGSDAGVYELGGPDTESFGQLIDRMLVVVRRRRLKLNMPFFLARMKAWGLDMLQMLTLGIFKNTIITRDQVRQLAYDNVVSDDAKGFADLGIKPKAMDAILESYLYCHRPQGQYTALTESAQNLRD